LGPKAVTLTINKTRLLDGDLSWPCKKPHLGAGTLRYVVLYAVIIRLLCSHQQPQTSRSNEQDEGNKTSPPLGAHGADLIGGLSSWCLTLSGNVISRTRGGKAGYKRGWRVFLVGLERGEKYPGCRGRAERKGTWPANVHRDFDMSWLCRAVSSRGTLAKLKGMAFTGGSIGGMGQDGIPAGPIVQYALFRKNAVEWLD
jgi:hypothetical protein